MQLKLDKLYTVRIIFISLIFKLKGLIPFGFGSSDKSINILKIKFLGSNHPRRTEFSSQFFYRLLSIIFNKLKVNRKESQSIINNRSNFIYKSKHTLKYNDLDQLIFCGDSHVEFFTRSNLIINKKKLYPMSIWLGPKTLVGFDSEKNQKDLQEILNKLKVRNSNNNRLIVFSLGSIDVRTSIGFLLSTGTFKSSEDCIDLIIRSYKSINEWIMKELGDLSNTKIAFLSIPPASPSKGISFLKCSKKEALKYKNESPFTVFGSPFERAEWTCLLNNKFKSIAMERGWTFIDNSGSYELVTDSKSYFIDKKYTFDETHIYKPEMYTQTIINCIESVYNS